MVWKTKENRKPVTLSDEDMRTRLGNKGKCIGYLRDPTRQRQVTPCPDNATIWDCLEPTRQADLRRYCQEWCGMLNNVPDTFGRMFTGQCPACQKTHLRLEAHYWKGHYERKADAQKPTRQRNL